MSLKHSERIAALALLAGMAWSTAADAADRPADKILEEIRGVQMPQIAQEDRSNRQAVQAYIAKRQAAMEKKASLIGELYQQHPDSPELEQLLPERWQALASSPATVGAAKAEIDRVIAGGKDGKLANEAAFLKVLIAFREAGRDPKVGELLPVVDEFVKRFPKDERGASLLGGIASMTKDEAQKEALNKRVEKDYPDSQSAQMLAGERKQREAVGKPFAISFTDAIKGGTVDSASLKGKVVIVDFWATWCGPCVAEMPKMKELYAKYRAQGVEFVGVSLDSAPDAGGYDELTKFVANNRIEWPQFYQGNGWESEFSRSCGIRSIPSVFLVAADGTLASTDARGKLDQMIPEYLEKAKAKKVAAAQP